MKKALITGLTGMDGSTLADLLLEKDYEVYGIVRRVSTPNVTNIQHLLGNPRVHLESGDLTDLASLVEICKEVMPDEVYNLAAQSFVGSSWRQPITTCEITGLGALNVFEAVRQTCPTAKIYQASSSEMFSGEDAPQTRTTPFKPRSPYGAAKLFAHHMARIYRESYGMFIACGILFNHTGPRRGIEFVTQKIVDHAVRQHYCGEIEALKLGNLDAKRDWSHAKDMVRGMWMMLQEGYPEDYILASGETHSVKEFVDLVYAELGTRLLWGEDSMGYDFATNPQGVMLVQSVPEFYRENEVNILQGDPTYANKYLGWEPEFTFSDLISDMIVSRIKKYYSKGV